MSSPTLIRVIYWLVALGASACLLLRWWPGERLTVVRLTIYLMPWLLVLLLPGLTTALLAQRKGLALVLALATALVCFAYAPLFFPRTKTALAGEERLTVMSYNIWSENQAMAEAAALIRRENPDILLLQEIRPWQLESLVAELDKLRGRDEMKLNVAFEPDLMQAVITPLPLIEVAAYEEKGQAQIVRVETSRGSITLFNIHPLRGSWLGRHNKIGDLLREDILPAGGPVIFAGDFNTTDQTRTYRLVARHLRDVHREAGFGFGFTFPAESYRLLGKLPLPALVRIDYIFCSEHFTALRSRTLIDSGGSDHRPVVAELAWREI